MYETINISSSLNDYEIVFPQDKEIYPLSVDRDQFYLIDANVYNIYYSEDAISENIIIIHAEEKNKTLIQAAKIIEELRSRGANRESKIHVIGGGIVQDVGTMVASIFMRGISWTLVPTTLLSMVDSCIGG